MEVADKFWALVYKTDICWFYLGGKHGKGYGNFGGRQAHVVAWELSTGQSLPPGKMILHSCDIRTCVNLDHLRLGTHAENMRDAMERGLHTSSQIEPRTHCKNGHEMTPENTWVYTWKVDGKPKIKCRACELKRGRDRRTSREKLIQLQNLKER